MGEAFASVLKKRKIVVFVSASSAIIDQLAAQTWTNLQLISGPCRFIFVFTGQIANVYYISQEDNVIAYPSCKVAFKCQRKQSLSTLNIPRQFWDVHDICAHDQWHLDRWLLLWKPTQWRTFQMTQQTSLPGRSGLDLSLHDSTHSIHIQW